MLDVNRSSYYRVYIVTLFHHTSYIYDIDVVWNVNLHILIPLMKMLLTYISVLILIYTKTTKCSQVEHHETKLRSLLGTDSIRKYI